MKFEWTSNLMVFFLSFSGFTAYSAILGVLLISSLGVPIPEDITLISAGILVALEKISFLGALILGFVGVLSGDIILFFIGRHFGEKTFHLLVFRKVFTKKRIQKARKKFLKNSRFICFTARFLPGLRAPIFLIAGIMGVHPLLFLSLDGFAALISVPFWIIVGWYFGKNMDEAVSFVQQTHIYLILALIVLIGFYIIWSRRNKIRNKAKDKDIKN